MNGFESALRHLTSTDPTIVWVAYVRPDADGFGRAAAAALPPDPHAAANAIADATPDRWAAAAANFPNGELIVAGLDLFTDDQWARANAHQLAFARTGQTVFLLTDEGLTSVATKAPWLRTLIGTNILRDNLMRGSRKHILDWTQSPNFREDLRQLVEGAGGLLRSDELWLPRGHEEPEEAQLDIWGPRMAPEFCDWSQLTSWWLAHASGAKRPNWDLVATCEIDGAPGLVLVEAKAHEKELEVAGKPLKADASQNSKANHENIGKAIESARAALDGTHPGVRISRDHHYQLSNRVAFSWKLATMGVPTILVYLGFTGDEGMKENGPPIRDGAHWEQVMTDYVRPVVPAGFIGSWIPCGPSKMKMIVRARPVIHQSAGRPSRVA